MIRMNIKGLNQFLPAIPERTSTGNKKADIIDNSAEDVFVPSEKYEQAGKNRLKKTDAVSPAIIRYSALRESFDKAISDYRTEHPGKNIEKGVENVNIFRFFDYLSGSCQFSREYCTGHEQTLKNNIIYSSEETGNKLGPQDVFKLSLELNNGNIFDSLVTAHNVMRNTARGEHWDYHKLLGIKQDRRFFGKYLSGDFTGKYTNDSRKTLIDDQGGNWYYFYALTAFSMATNHRTHHTPPFVNVVKDIIDTAKTVKRAETFGFKAGATGLLGPVALGVQLCADVLSSVLPVDTITNMVFRKSFSSILNDKLNMDEKNISTPSLGNMLPGVSVIGEDVLYKMFEKARYDESTGGKSRLVLTDRISVNNTAMSLGEHLNNIRN